MPPALQHKKTRSGCKRCKTRKVKCDEGKPKCGACSRHNVECEYGHVFEAERQASAGPSPSRNVDIKFNHDTVELRLMHQWTAYTCGTISTATEYWRYEVPMLALTFRHLLDGMFAVAALQLSRQAAGDWPSTDSSMPQIKSWETRKTLIEEAQDDSRSSVPSPATPSDLATVDSYEMLSVSEKLYTRALEGNRQAIIDLSEQNIRATFTCAVLISFYSLFTLNKGQGDVSNGATPGAMQWVSISRGAFPLAEHWGRLVGKSWIQQIGVMYGEPDLRDPGPLFRLENREHLAYLLAPVADDRIDGTNRSAYEDTLSYIGLIHKGILEGFDAPLGTQRRILAFPSRIPQQFVEFVAAGHPRAIAILAHFFAMMKLAEDRLPWLKDIARTQVPTLCNFLPAQWRSVVEWPLQVVNG